ncbi:ORF8 protein [229E-related bat coronavirus]|nr:ORF8 protein [229E-related bat coronavirus]
MHPDDLVAPLWKVLLGFVLVEGALIWLVGQVIYEIIQLLIGVNYWGFSVVFTVNFVFVLAILIPICREVLHPGAIDAYLAFLRSVHDGMIRAAFN